MTHRVEGQTLESCPAATGEDCTFGACPDFPDGAHRCGRNRDSHEHHNRGTHKCTCGARWYSHPVSWPADQPAALFRGWRSPVDPDVLAEIGRAETHRVSPQPAVGENQP
jgi:hypothetical protein